MNKKAIFALTAVLLALSFLPLLHQRIVWGYWFETKDALHHEVLSISLFTLATGIAMGYYLIYYRRKRQ